VWTADREASNDMSDRTGDDELLDAYGADCPFCGAPAGGPCRTASGKIAARPHADRPAVPYEQSRPTAPFAATTPTEPAEPMVATAYDDLAALVSAADASEAGDAAGDEPGDRVGDVPVPTTHHEPGEEPAEPSAGASVEEAGPAAFVVESDETADLPRVPVGDVRAAARGGRRGGPPSLLDTVRADVAELRIEPIRLAVVAAVVAALYFLVRAIR
jgi:hypothetical protein